MPSKTGVLKQAERRSDSSYALGVTSKKKSIFKDIIKIKVDHLFDPIFDKLFFDKF